MDSFVARRSPNTAEFYDVHLQGAQTALFLAESLSFPFAAYLSPPSGLLGVVLPPRSFVSISSLSRSRTGKWFGFYDGKQGL